MPDQPIAEGQAGRDQAMKSRQPILATIWQRSGNGCSHEQGAFFLSAFVKVLAGGPRLVDRQITAREVIFQRPVLARAVAPGARVEPLRRRRARECLRRLIVAAHAERCDRTVVASRQRYGPLSAKTASEKLPPCPSRCSSSETITLNLSIGLARRSARADSV